MISCLGSRVLQSPTDGISYFLPRHLLQTISSILGAFFVRSAEERARELAKFIGRVQCLICPLGAARETATTSTSAGLIRIHISQREVQGREEQKEEAEGEV